MCIDGLIRYKKADLIYQKDNWRWGKRILPQHQQRAVCLYTCEYKYEEVNPTSNCTVYEEECEKNYLIEAFTLLVQYDVLFPERMAEQLIW